MGEAVAVEPAGIAMDDMEEAAVGSTTEKATIYTTLTPLQHNFNTTSTPLLHPLKCNILEGNAHITHLRSKS